MYIKMLMYVLLFIHIFHNVLGIGIQGDHGDKQGVRRYHIGLWRGGFWFGGMRRVIEGLRENGVVRSDVSFKLEKRPFIAHLVLPGIWNPSQSCCCRLFGPSIRSSTGPLYYRSTIHDSWLLIDGNNLDFAGHIHSKRNPIHRTGLL